MGQIGLSGYNNRLKKVRHRRRRVTHRRRWEAEALRHSSLKCNRPSWWSQVLFAFTVATLNIVANIQEEFSPKDEKKEPNNVTSN